MIYYHPDCDLKFSEYGIEIPIVDDRAYKVFHSLKALHSEHNSELNYTDYKNISSITRVDLERAHNKKFIDLLYGNDAEIRYEIMKCYELINSDGTFERYNLKNQKKHFNELLKTVMFQVSMTYAATDAALKTGFSYYLGGGMHHAMSFEGRGFCLVNDLVITLRKLQAEKKIETAWIIDVDVHKGDGAAEILKNDKTIRTLSIHMKEGWPLNIGSSRDPWFIPSSVDIAIDVGEEFHYLAQLSDGLITMEERYGKPDVVIVVNGADPYEHDELPSSIFINLSAEQLFDRDKMIYDFFKTRSIPQSYVMAGGYGSRSWEIYFQFLKFVWQSSSLRSEISAG